MVFDGKPFGKDPKGYQNYRISNQREIKVECCKRTWPGSNVSSGRKHANGLNDGRTNKETVEYKMTWNDRRKTRARVKVNKPVNWTHSQFHGSFRCVDKSGEYWDEGLFCLIVWTCVCEARGKRVRVCIEFYLINSIVSRRGEAGLTLFISALARLG